MFGLHIKYHKVSSVTHFGPAYLRLQWSHATHASIDEEIIIHPTVRPALASSQACAPGLHGADLSCGVSRQSPAIIAMLCTCCPQVVEPEYLFHDSCQPKAPSHVPGPPILAPPPRPPPPAPVVHSPPPPHAAGIDVGHVHCLTLHAGPPPPMPRQLQTCLGAWLTSTLPQEAAARPPPHRRPTTRAQLWRPSTRAQPSPPSRPPPLWLPPAPLCRLPRPAPGEGCASSTLWTPSNEIRGCSWRTYCSMRRVDHAGRGQPQLS